MARILDYSRGRPTAGAIIEAGYQGAIRYLPRAGTTGVIPVVTAELSDFASRGLSMAFVHQHADRGRTLLGRPAGREDGLWVMDRVVELGTPLRCVYLANDFDSTAEQWPMILEYMLGAGEVLGLPVVGTYGEYDLLDYLFATLSITWGWQTYAWSKGHNRDDEPRHPRAHLFQRLEQVTVAGVLGDVNDVLKVDFGQIDLTGGVAAVTWRVARSLDKLLAQLNAMAPNRSKVSDGAIGDAAHATRDSDHNPWYGPAADGMMIVTARDFTHDPAGGLDCQWLADRLTTSGDRRIKYVIWNRRIWQDGAWSAYSGINPHTAHLHLSVVASPVNDDVSSWNLGAVTGGFLMALTDAQQADLYRKVVGLDSSLGYTWLNSRRLAGEVLLTAERMVKELVGAVAALSNGELDATALGDRLEVAAREAAEHGAQSAIEGKVLPAIQRIQDALAQDNTDEAKAFLAELGKQLSPAA